MNSGDMSSWVGKQQDAEDSVTKNSVSALAATFDMEPDEVLAAGILPELWHWMYFAPHAKHSELGIDGHPARGGFLPPVDLPNRMWAGGRLVFHNEIKIGDALLRKSEIIKCERKTGRNGDLVFVTVKHLISNSNGLALEEEHDIVYRNPPPAGGPLAGAQPAEVAEFRKRIVPDPVLLFRYSAVTFNGHRIHYDHPYATKVEGYPGLVFHGPLTATLLLGFFKDANPGAKVKKFSFRAEGPLFDNQEFDLCGRLTESGKASMWTDCEGRQTMKAHVEFTI